MQQKPLSLLQFQKSLVLRKPVKSNCFGCGGPKASSALVVGILQPISIAPVIYISANPVVTKLR